MEEQNPLDILNDLKSKKIDSFAAVEKLLSLSQESRDGNLKVQVSDILLEIYRNAETDENLDSQGIKTFMEEIIGKKFTSKYNIVPREAMALFLLELASGVELENEDEIPNPHHVHALFRIKEGHVIDIDIVEVGCPRITFIDLFPYLNYLRINLTGLNEIKRLEKLVKLEWLNLGSNELTEIKGLEHLQSLKKLHIYNNKISQLYGLDSLKNLEELQIHENPIKKLKGIKHLKKLKSIVLYETNLSEKQIKKIEKIIK